MQTMSENGRLRLNVAFFGLSISLFSIFYGDLIHRDAVVYIKTAEIFNESGFTASIKYFSWPFYSILIAFLHALTSLSYENSAHFLNVILLLLLVDAFTRVYWEINSKVIYRWMPAVILLAYTGINDYRPMIVRDWGYWAFLFQALYYFIKAYKNDQQKFYILWQCFILLALLFRIEAIVFIVVLPFIILIKKASITAFIKSGSLFLLPIVILFIIDLNWYRWGRVLEVLSYIDVVSFLKQFVDYCYAVANHAFRHHAENNAIIFIVTGLFGVLFVKTITKLGVLYIGIASIGYFRYRDRSGFNCFLVNILTGIAFFLVFVFFCKSQIIAGRYIIPITLMLLLYVTYYAERILDEVSKIRGGYLIVSSMIIVNLVIGLHHSKSNKQYIKEMGGWVIENIPHSARIYTNNKRLYYYSGGIENNNISFYSSDIENNNIGLRIGLINNDFVLLKVERDSNEYDQFIKEGKMSVYHSIASASGNVSAVLFKLNKP